MYILHIFLSKAKDHCARSVLCKEWHRDMCYNFQVVNQKIGKIGRRSKYLLKCLHENCGFIVHADIQNESQVSNLHYFGGLMHILKSNIIQSVRNCLQRF